MSLVVCSDVGISFGADLVVGGLELRIEPRDRLAVVGANGAGKSSVLNVLAGLAEPTEGSIERQRGLRMAYLAQDAPAPSHDDVLAEVIASRSDLAALREEMRGLEQAMSAVPAPAAPVLDRYGAVQHRYQDSGGYEVEARAREALGGLGLDAELIRRHPAELSGGQVRRVEMAKLLLRDADLLLVDEPTNHLDLAAIEWLEEFMASVPAALVVVSHDRRFLDRVCTSVLELSHGQAEHYAGGYTQYVRLRAERQERRRKDFEAQQAHIQHQEEFIRRYKAGQRAKQARGRQKLLDRVDRVAAPTDVRRPQLRFHPAPASNVLLRAQELAAGRDGAVLVTLDRTVVGPGDRVAIVGPNGSGKSTLLHTLAGVLPAISGTVRLGTRARMSLYRQDLGRDEAVAAGRTVVEELLHAHPEVADESARNLLGSLLFSGDEVFKDVGALSGGELARLRLGEMALEEANLLLLDEPTNHLDIPAQEVLEQALSRFEGGCVLVTHDRALIDAVATRTWAVEHGRVREVLGGYTDLLRVREREARDAAASTARAAGAGSAATARSTGSSPPLPPRPTTAGTGARAAAAPHAQQADRAAERAARAAGRRAEAEVRRLEHRIAEVEAAIADVRERLLDPATFADPATGAETGREHDRLDQERDRLYEAWAALTDGS